MAEFSLGGTAYRSQRLCAYDQWQLLNRMRPLLPSLSSLNLGGGVETSLADITKALMPLMAASDADLSFVFRMALRACEQRVGDTWGPVDPAPNTTDLLRLLTLVFTENFAALFALKRPDFRPTHHDSPGFQPVMMPDGEDWLFRPVTRGWCKAESLYDGALRVEHVAQLNDLADVEVENQVRMRKAMEKSHR